MSVEISESLGPLAVWKESLSDAVILDSDSYRTGSHVQFRLSDTVPADWPSFLEVRAVIRRAKECVAAMSFSLPYVVSDSFRVLWTIPSSAVTGRYVVEIELHDPATGTLLAHHTDISFAVWRSELVIDNFRADRRFYSPGDPITFDLLLTNAGMSVATGLRVEVGEAQYPWIATGLNGPTPQFFRGGEPFDLAPGESKRIQVSGRTRCGEQGGTVQYTATVRRGRSAEMVAFRSTPPVFLRCPRSSAGPVYPFSYMHSNLSQVRTGDYRDFYNEPPAASLFDLSRTSFQANKANSIGLNLGAEVTGMVVVELSRDGRLVDRCEVNSHGTSSGALLQFGEPGLYLITAKFLHLDSEIARSESVEISANELPRSLAIVCAHPDDEFLHPAAIRAAVENNVPVHLIYLTCGDAGGSDRFFGVDYGPAEAIEFGHIRMAEARAAANHLGIPRENLHFLGLPDGFLQAIRKQGRDFKPVFAPLLGTDHSPYKDVERSNLSFERSAVLQVLVELLREIDPDTVYTSHPDERHGDHSAAGWFTIEALRALRTAGELSTKTSLRTDQFYGPAASEPAAFDYYDHEFYASGESMARVQEAYWFYQSQGGNHARGHVLRYADLPRREYHQEIGNWEKSLEAAPVALREAV